MKNYEAIEQWSAGLNADKAYKEITALRAKYPWLKCDESYNMIVKMYTDLPRIGNMIKAQEKLNACYRRIIEVNKVADEAIISAVAEKYHPGLKL